MDEPGILFGLAHHPVRVTSATAVSPGGSETFHFLTYCPLRGGPASLPDEAQVTCLLPLLGPRSLPQEATWVLLGGGWQVRGNSPITFMMDRGGRGLGT